MLNDPTVILDEEVIESQPQPEATDSRLRPLSGRLTANGVEFRWTAKAIRGLWFVSVESATCGSRSQMTQDNPINFALELAKQVTSDRNWKGGRHES